METYKQVRVGLFIGLLGLNTLSACVNTSKQLNGNPVAIPNHVTGVANTPVWGPKNNGGSMGTIPGAHSNMNAVTENFIMNALQNGNKEWGDGVPQVANPMFLEDYIIQDLAQHGYAPERIEFFVKKGLNINAQDSEERTMLIWGMGDPFAPKIVKPIANLGGDVNMQTTFGGTALYFAIHKFRYKKIPKKTIRILLKYGADPCIRTKQGTSALDVAKHYSSHSEPDMRAQMQELLVEMENYKKCPVRARV